MKTKYLATAAASLLVGTFATGNVAMAEETVGQKLDDATVLAKVKANLLKEKEVDALDVNVDVKDGKVTLSGKADTDMERKKAEEVAKGTGGVASVENKIEIKK